MNELRVGVTVVLLAIFAVSSAPAGAQSLESEAKKALGAVVKDATSVMKSLSGTPVRKKRTRSSETSKKDDKPILDDADANSVETGPEKSEAHTTIEPPQRSRRRALEKAPRHAERAPPKTEPDNKPITEDAKEKADKPDQDKEKEKPPVVPAQWSPLEIELAKARCTQLLKGIDAVTIPEAPIREGACGNAAPVRLVSIGKNPEVAISPPAVLTCDMVVAMHKWVKGDLQALARRHLKADIIKIEVMSDYACRPTYGRRGNKLSQHGKVNALDISGFMTSAGKTASILKEWGQTKRDIAAELAAARAAAEKADADRMAAEKKAQENLRDAKAPPDPDAPPPPAAVGSSAGTPVAGLAKTTIIDGVPKLTLTLPGGEGKNNRRAEKSASLSSPIRLGGPASEKNGSAKNDSAKNGKQAIELKPTQSDSPSKAKHAALPATAVEPAAPAPKSQMAHFLHGAHRAACRIFGTTLGPEANEAHRNHFHVDMAERKFRKICD